MARLESKLGRLFLRVDARAAFSRTARFAVSATGSPTIGEIPGYAYCYAALGYHANGITFSMLAASLLTDAIRANAIPTRAFSISK
jgi:glycine/D-amino acid oxidase-like deaminating enzyme